MLVAGHVGRKVGRGFYRYENGQIIDPPQPQPVPQVSALPPVWVMTDSVEDRAPLISLLEKLGATVETGEQPSAEALCLLAPYGEDAVTAAACFGTDPARTLCIDLLTDLGRQRTLMMTPVTSAAMRDAAHALLASDG